MTTIPIALMAENSDLSLTAENENLSLTAENSDLSFTAESEVTTDFHFFSGAVNTRWTRAGNIRVTRGGNVRVVRGILSITPIKLTASTSSFNLTAEQ